MQSGDLAFHLGAKDHPIKEAMRTLKLGSGRSR
jgi:hypothetical protein